MQRSSAVRRPARSSSLRQLTISASTCRTSASQLARRDRPLPVSRACRIRPCSGWARRCTSPRRSRASSTSFIDWGDTRARRDSWALDRPLRRSSTLRVVYWLTVSPWAWTTVPMAWRTIRSMRPTRYSSVGAPRSPDSSTACADRVSITPPWLRVRRGRAQCRTSWPARRSRRARSAGRGCRARRTPRPRAGRPSPRRRHG